MVNCEECGKKLGFFKCYQHPTMGKKHTLCSECFDNVNESVTKWGEFVLSNSFNNKISQKSFELKWKTITPRYKKRRTIIDNVCAESGLFIKK